MNEYEEANSTLVAEANAILHDYGLLETLGKYGTPIIQGSYALNMMTHRDLDIHLENDEICTRDFFSLGRDIAEKLKPWKMSYRNELIGQTHNLPKGLYWGIYAKLPFSEEWKIDIWAMDSDQIGAFCRRFEDLKSRISEKNRFTILMIKSHFCRHPEYRKRFSGIDVYKSVIEENVKSVGEFSKWLKQAKGIE